MEEDRYQLKTRKNCKGIFLHVISLGKNLRDWSSQGNTYLITWGWRDFGVTVYKWWSYRDYECQPYARRRQCCSYHLGGFPIFTIWPIERDERTWSSCSNSRPTGWYGTGCSSNLWTFALTLYLVLSKYISYHFPLAIILWGASLLYQNLITLMLWDRYSLDCSNPSNFSLEEMKVQINRLQFFPVLSW